MKKHKLSRKDLSEILKLIVIIMIMLAVESLLIGNLNLDAITLALMTIIIFVIAKISFKDLE